VHIVLLLLVRDMLGGIASSFFTHRPSHLMTPGIKLTTIIPYSGNFGESSIAFGKENFSKFKPSP